MSASADGMGRMPPGLRMQAQRATSENPWLSQLMAMGYDESVARGMILGAALGCLMEPEPPSEAIRRMVAAAARAYQHEDAVEGTPVEVRSP